MESYLTRHCNLAKSRWVVNRRPIAVTRSLGSKSQLNIDMMNFSREEAHNAENVRARAGADLYFHHDSCIFLKPRS